MKDLINQKIQELIDIAESSGDNNTVIVMLTLQGSKISGDDYFLATRIQEIGREMLGRLKNQQLQVQAMKN